MSGLGKLRRSDMREPGPSVVPGEFHLAWADFEQIAEMLHADAGIHLPQTKVTLVYSRWPSVCAHSDWRPSTTIARSSPAARASTNDSAWWPL